MALNMAYLASSNDVRSAFEARKLWVNPETTIMSMQAILLSFLESKDHIMCKQFILTREGASIKANFAKTMQSHLGVDFITFNNRTSPVDRINQLVSKATNGLIPRLLSTIPDDTNYMILTTLYFQGKWKKPFKLSDTNEKSLFFKSWHSFFNIKKKADAVYKDAFLVDLANSALVGIPTLPAPLSIIKPSEVDNVNVKEVPMMNQYDQKHRYCETKTHQWVDLEFSDNRLCMILGLPKLPKIEESHVVMKDALISGLRSFPASSEFSEITLTRLSVPRFRTMSRYDMSELLSGQSFNLASLFEAAPSIDKANWKEMTDQNIALSKLLHVAVIDVDEHGAEAAAATFGAFALGFISKPVEISWVGNRPFVYSIYDKQTKMTLFTGVYA
jgi:serine protease inhibitor